MAKSSVRNWDTVATYVVTYPDDFGESAEDCVVQIGEDEDDGAWYLRTCNEAGESDDAPNGAYDSRDAAEAAAEALARSLDEADSADAETYLSSQLEDAAGEPTDDGEWCVYWASACAEDEGPRDRYATRGQADAAARLANQALAAAHPGPLLCAFETRELVSGEWERTVDK